ncbi:MAG: M56 family metallopeptidase [Chloroflexi bacterium]|nr:M56 family metallopeptidase [Chloroflexota bacterium]
MGEYILQSIVQSAIVLLAVGALLRIWRIRQAETRFIFHSLPLLLPLAYLPVFWLAYPVRASQYFRGNLALLDLRLWGSLLPWESTTIQYAAIILLAATLALYLLQVGFLLASRLRHPKAHEPEGAAQEKLASVFSGLPLFSSNPVRLLVADSQQPVLYAFGLRRQGIVISSWMVNALDDQELAGVLTHELVHLARRDNWMNVAVFALRTVTFYNPVGLISFHGLVNEIEHSCDAESVRHTGKPGAYASALLKIYRRTEQAGKGAGLRTWRNWIFSGTETLEQESEAKAIQRRLRLVLDPVPYDQRTSYPWLCLATSTIVLLGLMFFIV